MNGKKASEWDYALALWHDTGTVTGFMREQIAGLRDAAGDPLSDEVRRFLLNLLSWKLKKPRKPRGRPVAKSFVRKTFQMAVAAQKFWDARNKREKKRGEKSPVNTAMEVAARTHGIDEDAASRIVYPRKVRKHKPK